MSMATQADKRNDWAKRGAALRLQEIQQEMDEILAAFPELRGGAKTRRMSEEARKRMSEGMRRHWQKRRAADKSKK